MVEGVALGETKLTLVAITKDNAFSPLTKEITITITADEIITIAPRTFNLAEGSTQTVDLRPGTKANVSDTTITVTVENVGEGLIVTPLSLEFFNSTDKQSLTVEARANSEYIGDRTVTFNLRATGGFVDIVTVVIIEDQLRTIGLDVGPTNLSLSSRTPATLIEINVNNVVTDDVLRVVAEGTAIGFNTFINRGDPLRFEDSLNRTFPDLEEGTSIILPIHLYEPGKGTITFIASGDRADTETVTVQVTVTESSFIINAVNELTVVEPTDLNINISLPENENATSIPVSLTVEYLAGARTNLVDVVLSRTGESLQRTVFSGVINPRLFSSFSAQKVGGSTELFTLTRLPNIEGDTTIRVTVRPTIPEYQSLYQETVKDIAVFVNLPPIELSVEPSSLIIPFEGNGTFAVGVNAEADATITITMTPITSDIVSVVNNFAVNGEIAVNALSAGEVMLTIQASAFDYATETTQVRVVVQRSLDIVTDLPPGTVDLEEGSTQAISVSLSRIAEDSGSVTVTIEPEERSELSVSRSSLMFVTTESQTVIVTAINDDDEYTGDRNATLTLTANGYTTTTVTVNITDDEPQPIRLNVTGSTNLSLVRFTNTEITVSVEVAADLTVEAEGAVRLADGSTLVRTSLGDLGSTRIEISGAGEGDGTVTFMVSGDRKATDTVVVNVDVTRPTLVISEVSPSSINLLAYAEEALTVRVSAEAGEPNDVTLTATVLGTEVASVMSPQIRNIDVAADTLATFIVEGLSAGTATLMLTAEHSDYNPASIEVTVTVSTPALVISNVSALDINLAARTTEELTVTVSAEAGEPNDVILTVAVLGEGNVASVTQAEISNVAADTTARFTVAGLDAGIATFMLTASRSGYSSASTEVTVTVYLPPVGLSVPTSLEFEQGATGLLTVGVSESTQATITIESNDTDIARVPDSAATFTLMGGEGNSTMIEVSGNDFVGVTTLKVTATADGYEQETVIVTVEALNRLRIEAPATFDLTERESTQISVRLTRIAAGIDTVMLEIEPGSGLTVSSSSLTFMDTMPQTVNSHSDKR